MDSDTSFEDLEGDYLRMCEERRNNLMCPAPCLSSIISSSSSLYSLFKFYSLLIDSCC